MNIQSIIRLLPVFLLYFPHLGYSQSGLDQARSKISMSYGQNTPVKYEEYEVSSFSIRSYQSQLAFTHQANPGLIVNTGWIRSDVRVESDDSTAYYHLHNAKNDLIYLSFHHTLKRHNIKYRVDYTRNIGLTAASFNYSFSSARFSITAGLKSNLHFQLNQFGTMDNAFTGDIYMNTSDALLEVRYKHDLGEIQAYHGESTPWRLKIPEENSLRLLIEPFSRSISFAYSYPDARSDGFDLFTSFELDTANADIIEETSTIGKVYAFDRESIKIGARMRRSPYELSLTYQTIQGKLSGYVLTAPFGELLSQLSGARFYGQIEADLSMITLKGLGSFQISPEVDMTLVNILYSGQANLHARHYVFQFFNPLTDLTIQDIVVSRFVINDIDLALNINIGSNYRLLLESGYILPIYIKMNAHPDLNSDGDGNTSDVSIGLRYQISFAYSF